MRFTESQNTLGWTLIEPGFAAARDFVWVEVVTSHVLAPDVEPVTLAARGLSEDMQATCLTTVDLSNGERVGSRRTAVRKAAGTINTLVHVSRPLTPEAFFEAISIVTQARTAALIDTDHLRAIHGLAIRGLTGTGTDRIVIAASRDGEALPCVGLHTAVGEAIGDAVYRATKAGSEQWSDDAANWSLSSSSTP